MTTHAEGLTHPRTQPSNGQMPGGDAHAGQMPGGDAHAGQVAITVPAQAQILPDPWIYRATVAVLGITILLVTGGALFLRYHNPTTDIPPVMVALGSGAIGALAGLLAPTPAGNHVQQPDPNPKHP